MADEKPRKPAAKKPAAKKPAAPKKQAPKKQAAPKQPEELGADEDFLDDIDSEIDDIVSAPTEEHPAPTGAVEPEDQEDEELDDEELDDEDADDEEPDGDEGDEGDEQPTLIGAPAVSGNGGGGGEGTEVSFGRPKRRFPLWARFITGSLIIVLAVASATAASALVFLDDFASALAHGNALKNLEPDLTKIQGGEPETIMVVGSDRRKGNEGAGVKYGLSDTTILLRIDPDRNAISLLSIPRDLEVNIPGYGTDKFNAAYSLGGPKLTLLTVKDLTGLDINHVVNVDFTGFVKAVGAIGCVYVDVDRRYYHSNQGLSASAEYAEINVRPGYQRLCGYNALAYVRYRHTDNDIVRNARQQDFLREARARVPATDLLIQRHDLIDIFTEYTTSDIGDKEAALQVLKLLIAARNEPIKEVHFPGTVGAQVTVTPTQMEQAVSQFLGTEGTKGPRGESAAPTGTAPAPEAPPSSAKSPKGAKAKAAKPAKPTPNTLGVEGGSFGRKLALRVHRKQPGVPVYYPTTIIAGSTYPQDPRAYSLADPDLSPAERPAYKYVLKTPSGEYYGLQGLAWKNPPILDEPHETKQFGDREYKLYYDNDRLRLISWETDDGVYWVQNTLLQSLTADQMVAIARGATPLTAVKKKK